MALPAELQKYDALIDVLVEALLREAEAGEGGEVEGENSSTTTTGR